MLTTLLAYRCLTEGRYVEPAQGKPYLGLKHDVIVGDFTGKNFYQDVYVTPDSLFYGYPHFKALGLLSFEAISDANIADWVCDITVKTETTRSGKTRQVVTNLVVVERRETTEQKAAEPAAQ